MKKYFYLFIFLFSLLTTNIKANNNIMILKLTYGEVKIELFADKAPNHVKRFKELADAGKYDGVVFHRVIDGFMAQTGDVKFGNSNNSEFNLSLAGTGGSELPNLKAEFSDIAHSRGTLSAARSADPDSANSQFFICFDDAPHLDRQYSAFGKVVEGMEYIDMIKKGDPNSGSVPDPDKIISLKSK
jgi:peptidyl-prolyl cis-trans isomerase B (cyclophilin B)